MKRNRRLLLKTAKRIEDVPASYNQGIWVDEDDRSPCGTVACLAGELIICSERSVAKGIDKLFEIDRSPGGRVWATAQHLAGLSDSEGNELFFGASAWPKPFSSRYFRAKTQRGRANAAAALLRYLADGGKV